MRATLLCCGVLLFLAGSGPGCKPFEAFANLFGPGDTTSTDAPLVDPTFVFPAQDVQVSAPITIAVDGEGMQQVRFLVDGALWVEFLDPADGRVQAEFDPADHEPGSHFVAVTVLRTDGVEFQDGVTVEVVANDPAPPAEQFNLTVAGGSGGGSYAAGAVVQITADDAPQGKVFDLWTGDIAGIADVNASATTLAMPAQDTNVSATFKDKPTDPTGEPGANSVWSRIEVTLTGPDSQGMGTPNPFKIDVDVVFSGPGGASFTVPAFYDGDGGGGMDGSVWKARLMPDRTGAWTWQSSSGNSTLDGQGGTFDVVAQPQNAPEIYRSGMLQWVAGPYLKFADGPYWIKGGADEPESFLGKSQLPTTQSRLDAIDLLASYGGNSMYVMTHNIDGDGDNTWPWVGTSGGKAKTNTDRFDVAKLAVWETVFSYMQKKGVVIHLVLEDDSGWTGFDRDMYYRAIVARFAHHPALIWNISEEYGENYSSGSIKSFAAKIRALDAYDHPTTVHNVGSLSAWDPFLGDSNFDLTSFQTGGSPQNSAAVQWWGKIKNSSRRIVMSFDENGLRETTDRNGARRMAWSVFLGGGNHEIFTRGVYSNSGKTFADFQDHFEDITRARKFLEDNVSFWQGEPRNDLLQGAVGNDYLFAKVGSFYCAYTEAGNAVQVNLQGVSGTFAVKWYNPRTGEYTDGSSVSGGAVRDLGKAPFGGDAAVLVKLVE